MIHGVLVVWVNSAIEMPIPIELPAWKDAVTKKTPKPIATPAFLPHFCLMVVNNDWSMAMPMRADMVVKMAIKKTASTIIQINEYENSAPSLEVIVILLGPKTNAAVIMPGPKDSNHLLKELNIPSLGWVVLGSAISFNAIIG